MDNTCEGALSIRQLSLLIEVFLGDSMGSFDLIAMTNDVVVGADVIDHCGQFLLVLTGISSNTLSLFLIIVVIFELFSILGIAETLQFEGLVFNFIEMVPLLSTGVTTLACELCLFS